MLVKIGVNRDHPVTALEIVKITLFFKYVPPPRGGVTPLYRYVRPQRVWFFSCFGHKYGINLS